MNNPVLMCYASSADPVTGVNLPVTAATPLPVRATGTGTGNSTQVEGNSPSGTTDTGNPVKAGGKYNLTPPVLADGQRGDMQLDSGGNLSVVLRNSGGVPMELQTSGAEGVNGGSVGLVVASFNKYWNGTTWDRQKGSAGDGTINKPYALNNADWTYGSIAGGITNTTAVVMKAAAGVGIRNYLTGLSITNSSGTIATEIEVLDGVTVIGRWFVGSNLLLNSAVGLTFPTPIRSTANTALSVRCVTTGAAVYVNAQGYVAP